MSESKFKFVRHVDYALISALKHEGYLTAFRTFFRQLISRLNAQPKASDDEIGKLTNDMLEIAADSRKEWVVIEEVLTSIEKSEFSIEEGQLVLDIEEDAYMSPDIDRLWAKYVKGAED